MQMKTEVQKRIKDFSNRNTMSFSFQTARQDHLVVRVQDWHYLEACTIEIVVLLKEMTAINCNHPHFMKMDQTQGHVP